MFTVEFSPAVLISAFYIFKYLVVGVLGHHGQIAAHHVIKGCVSALACVIPHHLQRGEQNVKEVILKSCPAPAHRA